MLNRLVTSVVISGRKAAIRLSAMEDTGDRTWGHLASTEHLGRPNDPAGYIQLKKEELNTPLYGDCIQASHCMIYAKQNKKVFGVYHPRAAVMMQMRFDGYLGFPGGLIDSGEDKTDGLNREMVEELNLDLAKHRVQKENYIVSHYSNSKRICLHFYALEVSLPDYVEIEKRAVLSKDYGSEVLGTIRIPLYTMGDGFRGFPLFLNNRFIGNSKEQLLHTLGRLNILTGEEISGAVDASRTSGGT